MAAGDLVDIPTALSTRRSVNVIGVVVDALPPYRTKGSSACVTFTIKDSEFDAPTWHGGLKVKYFNNDESHLPGIRVNDVVLLRNIRVRTYESKPTGVASQYDDVPWAVFRPETTPGSTFVTSGPIPCEPSLKERDRAQSLLDSVSSRAISVQPPTSHNVPSNRRNAHHAAATPAPKTGGLPYVLIQDAEVHTLCQLVGQVVKLNTFDSEKTLLYLTDYTRNENLTNYKKPGEEDDDSGPEGDRFNFISKKHKDWPGPWGRLILPVTLWEPHATHAREHIQPGDIVRLTYARIKPSQSGIEGAIHEDRRFPEKIHIRKISGGNDERVQALMERRADYWKVHGEPKAETKKAKKRNKKVEQKREVRKKEGQLILPAASRVKLNPHVKIRNYVVPIIPLERILLAETHKNNAPGGLTYQLPFQNVNYRTQARVVDFFPHSIEDFAVQTATAPLFGDEKDPSSPKPGWEWRFCLLVEGVEPRPSKQEPRQVMKLYVSGLDGDCLLNGEACNLRNNHRRLHEVTEKLFLLWGNLEEEKSKAKAAGQRSWGAVSSRPFECYIKEYGVRCTHDKDLSIMDLDGEVCSHSGCFGWERRFAIHGTTIHT